MKRIKILLKVLLLLSIVSFFSHLYVSVFAQEFCSWNRGIVFGFADFLNPYVLSSLLIIFLFFTIYILWQQYGKYWEIFVVLMISSLANVLDRLMHGAVCDYIDIKVFFNFPILNLNDIFISIALIIILLLVLYDSALSKERGN